MPYKGVPYTSGKKKKTKKKTKKKSKKGKK